MTGTGIEGYRIYLAHRDGEADLLHRRLTNREEFFASLEGNPVRSPGRHHPPGRALLRLELDHPCES